MFGKSKKPVEPELERRRTAINQAQSSRPAFSYYSSQNRPGERSAEPISRRGSQVEETDEQRKHRVRNLTARLPLLFVLALIVVCMVKILTLGSNPRIIVVGNGSEASYVQDSGVYADEAAKILRSNKLNAFKLTADLNGASKQLQQAFPELQTVSITAPFIGSRPVVYVMPAQAGIILQTGSGSYAVNGSGVVLREVTDVSREVAVKVLDQTGVQAVPGKRILPASTVNFIQRLNYQLTAGKQTVTSMTLPATNAYEVDVRLSGKPYFIKTNLQGDPMEQAGAALATLGQASPAEYLDVRVPGRAYYK